MDEERGKGRKNDFAANCSERRGRTAGGARAQRRRRRGAREVGVGGIKICIDASQIYRGWDFVGVSVIADGFVSVFSDRGGGMSAIAGVAEKHSLHFERASRYNPRPRRPSRRDLHIPSMRTTPIANHLTHYCHNDGPIN